MNRTAYLYVFDTMSDWEIGYITAELHSGRYYKKGLPATKIVTVGLEKAPITTMGGLKILPDMKLDECSITSADMLILPGGETWLEAVHEPLIKIVDKCIKDDILVAAICGATMGLAQAGLLNTRPHTSNDGQYLKMVCTNYKGEEYYQMESVVTDGRLITASGIAPIEFSVHILKALGVFHASTLTAWYLLNKTHEPAHFYELMSSLQ